MINIRSLCVFCGSREGEDPAYQEEAQNLGRLLAKKDISLIYGGGKIGLMGLIADSVLMDGGEVIGVIPEALYDREVGHDGVTSLHIVQTMHQRKDKMAQLADGFIALPGGMGTLEELCEILTWAQLGIHHKPCGLLNVNGYFDFLLKFFDQMVDQGFLESQYLSLFVVDNTAEGLLEKLEAFTPLVVPQWLDSSKT